MQVGRPRHLRQSRALIDASDDALVDDLYGQLGPGSRHQLNQFGR